MVRTWRKRATENEEKESEREDKRGKWMDWMEIGRGSLVKES